MHSTMFAVIVSMVTIGIQAQPPAAKKNESGLAGTSWQLVRIQYMDDKVLTPDDPAKYTLAFGTDGRVSMRIDCNRATGRLEVAGKDPTPDRPARRDARDVPARIAARSHRQGHALRPIVRAEGR